MLDMLVKKVVFLVERYKDLLYKIFIGGVDVPDSTLIKLANLSGFKREWIKAAAKELKVSEGRICKSHLRLQYAAIMQKELEDRGLL